MASAESQFCNSMIRQWSSMSVPACLLYSVRAVSKRYVKLDSEDGSEDMRKEGVIVRFVVATGLPTANVYAWAANITACD